MIYQKKHCLLFLSLLIFSGIPVFATDKTWQDPLTPALKYVKGDRWQLGGEISFQYRLRDYGEEDTREGDLDFNQFKLKLNYKEGDWQGKALYTFYHYEDYGRSFNFLQEAWVQYHPNENQHVRMGIQQVPFGITPFASKAWQESLAFPLGLEDDYDLGVNWEYRKNNWKTDLAYFYGDEGNYRGKSKHSANYSYDPVEENGYGNSERHQLNLRIIYDWAHTSADHSYLGLSLQYGRIPNSLSRRTGNHYAIAAHWQGEYGNWSNKTEFIYYRYDLRNPVGTSNKSLALGGFDFPLTAAAEASLYLNSLAYTFHINRGALQSLQPFIEYSYMDKNGFNNSEHLALGVIFNMHCYYISADYYITKGSPFAGDYSQGLADRSGQWKNYLQITFSYYF